MFITILYFPVVIDYKIIDFDWDGLCLVHGTLLSGFYSKNMDDTIGRFGLKWLFSTGWWRFENT
jgi:hypothetical protein